MRFVAISDVHLGHNDASTPFTAEGLPAADVLLDAGDMTYTGKIPEIVNAASWRGALRNNKKYKHIIVIAGNHDYLFQRQHYLARQIMNDNGLIYLEDEAVTLEDDAAIPGYHPGPGRITIYGSPWQPEFNNWAFNLPRGERLQERWSHIPNGIDILITHGPPHGILDRAPRSYVAGWGEGEDLSFNSERVGCYDLLMAVQRTKPRVHLFGHIHADYGRHEKDGTLFLNASIMDERYDPTRKPHVFELEPQEKPQAAGEPEKAIEP